MKNVIKIIEQRFLLLGDFEKQILKYLKCKAKLAFKTQNVEKIISAIKKVDSTIIFNKKNKI